jgi:hypothetical protein
MMHTGPTGVGLLLDEKIRIHDAKHQHHVVDSITGTSQLPIRYNAGTRGGAPGTPHALLVANHEQWLYIMKHCISLQTRHPVSSTIVHLVYASDNVLSADVITALQSVENVRHVAIIVRGLDAVLGLTPGSAFKFKLPSHASSRAAAIEAPFVLGDPKCRTDQDESWLSYALSYVLLNSDTDGDVLLRYISKLVKTDSTGLEEDNDLVHRITQHPSFATILTLIMRNA